MREEDNGEKIIIIMFIDIWIMLDVQSLNLRRYASHNKLFWSLILRRWAYMLEVSCWGYKLRWALIVILARSPMPHVEALRLPALWLWDAQSLMLMLQALPRQEAWSLVDASIFIVRKTMLCLDNQRKWIREGPFILLLRYFKVFVMVLLIFSKY